MKVSKSQTNIGSENNFGSEKMLAPQKILCLKTFEFRKFIRKTSRILDNFYFPNPVYNRGFKEAKSPHNVYSMLFREFEWKKSSMYEQPLTGHWACSMHPFSCLKIVTLIFVKLYHQVKNMYNKRTTSRGTLCNL